MDHGIVHDKIWVFAQQLLHEAKGDPVRALGLLVLVLDGPEVLSSEHAWRLVTEVRHVLLPETMGESPFPFGIWLVPYPGRGSNGASVAGES